MRALLQGGRAAEGLGLHPGGTLPLCRNKQMFVRLSNMVKVILLVQGEATGQFGSAERLRQRVVH